MSGHERVSILVADYDRWTRLSVASMLSAAGFTVDEASNGMSAVRMACAVAPHVVMLGRELPEIATAEVVALLRSDPRTRDAAVVHVSPDLDPHLETDGSIRLPCNPLELFATVIDALDARRAVPQPEAATATPTRSVSASPRGV